MDLMSKAQNVQLIAELIKNFVRGRDRESKKNKIWAYCTQLLRIVWAYKFLFSLDCNSIKLDLMMWRMEYLNVNLLKSPHDVIAYIGLHELAHLKIKEHSSGASVTPHGWLANWWSSSPGL